MITATITYLDQQRNLAINRVQILAIETIEGRAWAKVRALDGEIFPRLPASGQTYYEDWTIIDRGRLKDVRMALPTPDRRTFPRKSTARRLERSLLRDTLLGGGHERARVA